MPEVGEIQRGWDIGKGGTTGGHCKYIWSACELCGKERWEKLVYGTPESKRCISCALTEIHPCGFLGKHHTEDAKRRIGESHRGSHRSLESREKMSVAKNGFFIGENNPNWLGGISSAGYPCKFNENLKERIRDRDNHTCQLCGKLESECSRKLDIHHIDYVKENICETNLISLCWLCNIKANYSRVYWQNYFQNKIATS